MVIFISLSDSSHSQSKRKRSSTDDGKPGEEAEEDTLGDMAVTPRGGRSASKAVHTRASVAGYPVHNGVSGGKLH